MCTCKVVDRRGQVCGEGLTFEDALPIMRECGAGARVLRESDHAVLATQSPNTPIAAMPRVGWMR